MSFYRQEEIWPYVRNALEFAAEHCPAQEYYLGIDSSTDKVPPLGNLPWQVLRASSIYDGIYTIGATINKVMKLSDSNVLFTMGGDCLVPPNIFGSVRAIYAGALRQWEYSVPRAPKCIHKVRSPWKEFYTGGRFFIEGPDALHDIRRRWSWANVMRRAWIADEGWRGRPRKTTNPVESTAALATCCSAFPMDAIRKTGLPVKGRLWEGWLVNQMAKIGVASCPFPDSCFVLHIGETGTFGGYYHEEWKGPVKGKDY